MNILYNKLPKDLVYIIEDFAKDRTNYDKVIDEFQKDIFTRIEHCFKEYFFDARDFSIEYENEYGELLTFNELKKEYPEWYDKHIVYLNRFINYKNYKDLFCLHVCDESEKNYLNR